MFVQHVFIDTHDLRFPTLSFFAAHAIKAGEELTWDYGYEVGLSATKFLFCQCGAECCQGRIL
jgi:SET domain-containing protein